MGFVSQAVQGLLGGGNSTNNASYTAGQLPGLQGQQNLAGQLQNQANGQGPNPAQALFNQNTNQAIRQNAGLVASQKGLNAGQAARYAGQNAAMMQGQTAGNAAALNAQQQLGAQSELGNVYNSMNSATNEQSNVNSGMARNNANNTANTIGGIGSGLMGMASFLAEGGPVPQPTPTPTPIESAQASMRNAFHYDSGGMAGYPPMGVGGWVASQLMGMGNGGNYQSEMSTDQGPMAANVNPNQISGMFKHGAQSPIGSTITPATADGGLESAGGGLGSVIADSPGIAMAAARGGLIKHMEKFKKPVVMKESGGGVPGKAKVKGDSYSNDTVPAVLSPGEVVITRSVMQSSDPSGNAARFVSAVMAKKKMGR